MMSLDKKFPGFILLMFFNGMFWVSTACAHDKCDLDKQHKKYNIGGQVRLRGDFVRNQNLNDFSFSPHTHDEQLVSRTRLDLSLEPIEQIKGFVQGQFYNRLNHKGYSKLNLYQSYLDFSSGDDSPFTIRLGRQKICYGSAFFLGVNDFYDGLVWDGAKLNIAPSDKLWVDLIGARYVDLNKHKSKEKPALYGFYSGYKLKEDTDAQLYFFYHKGGFSFFIPICQTLPIGLA